jgi:CheY-like chemotaxis protein
MPEMDGYEATSIIRNELQDNIPIIALTAHALNPEGEKCPGLGMNEFITKPFDLAPPARYYSETVRQANSCYSVRRCTWKHRRRR